VTKPLHGVDLSLRQFREAWLLMCRGCAGRVIASGDGIDYIFSGLPVAFFNIALVAGEGVSGDALKAGGDAAMAWAAGRQLPWLFMVTHEQLETGVEATSVLDGCGLGPALPMTGMFAQQVGSAATCPEGLQLTVPQDDAGCAAVVDLNSAAYGLDLSPTKSVLGARAFWADHVPVVGLVDGAPASSAAVLVVDGYRYVALVATDPAHQRRGYADATMRHALQVAARGHGELPTVLHATDAGRPIYERMGYTPISTHTLYMDKALLGGH
jgi:GNAT superfamily N-acetyltransferase